MNKYHWGGGNCRPYLKKFSTRRYKQLKGKRRIRITETVRALHSITETGFAYTDNLIAFAEVIGHLKSHNIPYEYIDGGKDWTYAIRRLDLKTEENSK